MFCNVRVTSIHRIVFRKWVVKVLTFHRFLAVEGTHTPKFMVSSSAVLLPEVSVVDFSILIYPYEFIIIVDVLELETSPTLGFPL